MLEWAEGLQSLCFEGLSCMSLKTFFWVSRRYRICNRVFFIEKLAVFIVWIGFVGFKGGRVDSALHNDIECRVYRVDRFCRVLEFRADRQNLGKTDLLI